MKTVHIGRTWYHTKKYRTELARRTSTLGNSARPENTYKKHTHSELKMGSHLKRNMRWKTSAHRSVRSHLQPAVLKFWNSETAFNFHQNHHNESVLNTKDVGFDEARYNLATRIMSNGVEVIIASEKVKSNGPVIATTTTNFRPMTLAPSTLKNQMILTLPSNIKENFKMPIISNHFITKTCLTTYTYRTTYLENGITSMESREKVISNIATEERNYLRMSSLLPSNVTLTRTPDLVIGVFPTTYLYYNTIIEDDLPLVVSSRHTVVNTITGPDDYIAFLQPSEVTSPTHNTNTYYNRVTITKTIRNENQNQIVTSDNILTQVIVTKSFPVHSTLVLTSNFAYKTGDTSVRPTKKLTTIELKSAQQAGIITYHHTYTNDIGKERVETILKNLHKSHTHKSVTLSAAQDLSDVHIYATKTFLTTFTYYTSNTVLNMSPLTTNNIIKISSRLRPSDVVYRTHVIENVITDTVPSFLLHPELISKFHTELMQKKGKNQRSVIITIATLLGGQTLEITAMKIMKVPGTVTSGDITSASKTAKESSSKTSTDVIIKNIKSSSIINPTKTAENILLQKTKHKTSQSVFVNNTDKSTGGENIEHQTINADDTGFYGSPVYVSAPPLTIKSNRTKIPENNNRITAQLPTAVNQILNTFNFQQLRPMFSAVADLLQTKLITYHPQKVTAIPKPIPDFIENKYTLKNLILNGTDRPIYIPVQNNEKSVAKDTKLDRDVESTNIKTFVAAQSLHITPPNTVNSLLPNEENWPQDPNSNMSSQYKTTLLSGGIPIRPGEIITANSDLIIGRPNGIQVPRIQPSDVSLNIGLYNDSENPEIQSTNQLTFYKQTPIRKKSSTSVTSNIIPLNAPRPNNVHLNELSNKPIRINKNVDHILSPPPPPMRTSLKYLYKWPLSSPLKSSSPNFNNEILQIQRVPQVFSLSVPAVTASYHNWAGPKILHEQQKHIQTHNKIKPNPTTQAVIGKMSRILESNDGLAYGAHQHVNLKTDVLSHNIAMNVPPLTFKKEADDYPPIVQAIHGHIDPYSGEGHKRMPQVKIPANEIQFQVNLTPNSGFSFPTMRNLSYNKIFKTIPKSDVGKQQSVPQYSHRNQEYQKHIADITAIGAFTIDLNNSKNEAEYQEFTKASSHNSSSSSFQVPLKVPTISSNDVNFYQQIKNSHIQHSSMKTANNLFPPFPTNELQSPIFFKTALLNSFHESFKENNLDQKTADTTQSFYAINHSSPVNHHPLNNIPLHQRVDGKEVSKITFIPPTITHEHKTTTLKIAENSSRTTPYMSSFKNTAEAKVNKKLAAANILHLHGSHFVISKNDAANKTQTLSSVWKNILITSENGIESNITNLTASPESTGSKNKSILLMDTLNVSSVKASTMETFTYNNSDSSIQILMPPHVLNSNGYVVFGLSPPPPASIAQSTSNKYSTTYYVNKLKSSFAPTQSSLPVKLVARGKLKSKTYSKEFSILKPPTLQIIPTVSFNEPNITNGFILRSVLNNEINTSSPFASSMKIKINTEIALITFINSHVGSSSPMRQMQATKSTLSIIPYINETTPIHQMNHDNPLYALESSELSLTENIRPTKYLSSASIQISVASRPQKSQQHPLNTLTRLFLPTKYITSTQVFTVTMTKTSVLTTTARVRGIDVQSLQTKLHYHNPVSQTTTYFVTKTQTILNTLTEIRTNVFDIEQLSPTKTASIYKISTEDLTEYEVDKRDYQNSSLHLRPSKNEVLDYKNVTMERKGGFYNVHPSVEIVLSEKQLNLPDYQGNNIPSTKDTSSIFIVMTDNNFSKVDTIGNVSEKSDILGLSNNVQEGVDVPMDNEFNISFELPSKDEEISPIDVSSGSHVLIGGVLIATPPRITDYNGDKPNTFSLGIDIEDCQPICKSSRNEICSFVNAKPLCICRPGFDRMFPDRPCKPTYTFEMRLQTEHIGNYQLKYNENLKNNSSDEYRHLSSIILDAVDRMVMQSDFRDIYHGVKLIKFDTEPRYKDVLADFLLQLSDNSDEKRLQNVFKKYLRQSNYSIGGTELYTSLRGVQFLTIKDFDECISEKYNDCGRNAQCFNLQGLYTCSCQNGYADLSPNIIYPGRICSKNLIGCEICHYHGNCVPIEFNHPDKTMCECFSWYTGASCQLNMKIVLFSLITAGTLIFLTFLLCIFLTYTKRHQYKHSSATSQIFIASSLHPNMISTTKKSAMSGSIKKNVNSHARLASIDKLAMIKDTSSESSHSSLPYIFKESITKNQDANESNRKKSYNRLHHDQSLSARNRSDHDVNVLPTHSIAEFGQTVSGYPEQSDRSLTVMIPRAKYHHPSVQPKKQLMHHKLTLEREDKSGKFKITPSPLSELSLSTPNAIAATTIKNKQDNKVKVVEKFTAQTTKSQIMTPGALVSAGFEVSAIVSNHIAVNSSITECIMEQENSCVDNCNTFECIHSTAETIASSTIAPDNIDFHINNTSLPINNAYINKHFLNDNNKTDFKDCSRESFEVRSFEEAIVQSATNPKSFLYETQVCNTNDEANTMAEKDVGSTFLLPHTHLYKPEKQESEVSGFDSI